MEKNGVMKMVPFLAIFLLCLALPAAAEAPPVPKPRPEKAEAATSKSSAAIPVPRPRGDSGARTPPPPPAPTPEAAEQTGWPDDVVAEARAQCDKLLAGLPITYKPLDPIGNQGGCGAPAPILITAVAGVALAPPATQTCDMGAALAGWIVNSLKPTAQEKLHTDITVIHTATSYACRRRNNGTSGKMSEHSKANGLDMAGFSFASDKKVGVDGSWGQGLLDAVGLSSGASFLDLIRKSSCTYFTTVLGPGSDPYHGDHFHVDVLRRKNDYRICQ